MYKAKNDFSLFLTKVHLKFQCRKAFDSGKPCDKFTGRTLENLWNIYLKTTTKQNV